MANTDLDECRICGAMVEQRGWHNEWHDVLNTMVPGLNAELERRKEERKRNRTGRAEFL